MKPNFALTLSFEGIGLLHRSDTGWDRVGEVPLDVPDLPQALNLLKKTASELTSDALNAKLILPSEQIKYIRLPAPEGGRDAQESAVRAALDGTTPYALDELSYDWSESHGELTVAAVARETLREAEGFARENGFDLVYFAAQPEAEEFSGEPFFGKCESYAAESPVERDNEAVKVTGVARMPDPVTEPKPVPTAPTETKSDDISNNEAAARAPVTDEFSAPEKAPEMLEKKAPEQKQPEPEQAPPAAAFSSRRSEGGDGAPPVLSGVTRHETGQKPSAVAPTIPLPASESETPEKAPLAPPMPKAAPAPIAGAERSAMSFFSRRSSGTKAPAGKIAPPPPAAARKRNDAPTPPLPAPPPNIVPPSQSEKQRLTVFGARKPEKLEAPVAVMGKPRFLGLILTAVLLVFLLGVAAWASIFVGEGLSRFLGSERTDVATALPDLDETEIEGEEAMLPENPLELASLSGTPEGIVENGDARATVQPVSPITVQEAQENYAVTGIWTLPPSAPDAPAPGRDDDLYIASIDSEIGSQDAIALPPLALEQVDGGLGEQANPSAQGQQFELNENGLVIATPEGAISPEGHMVFAGKPPYFPKSYPDRSEAPEAVEEAPNALAAFRPKARPEGLEVANERANLGGLSLNELAAIRPKLRPPSATEIAAAVPRAEPDPAPGAELEAAIEEAISQAVPPTAGAVVIRVPNADTRDLDPNATPQAVARSVKPKDRPRNFDRIVKQAERNQQEEEVTQVAAVAPRTVAPAIPSRSSVTKQATVRNAINLRRVNLIGVYGKPSSRRALVRLSNGRYRKVAVGDRIDGGRVSAIGDTELRYQKNGRDVTLKMPKG